MSETPEQTPTLVHSVKDSEVKPLPLPVMASLLIEIHAGLMADGRLQHLAGDLEAIIYEIAAAAKHDGSVPAPAASALRLVKNVP